MATKKAKWNKGSGWNQERYNQENVKSLNIEGASAFLDAVYESRTIAFIDNTLMGNLVVKQYEETQGLPMTQILCETDDEEHAPRQMVIPTSILDRLDREIVKNNFSSTGAFLKNLLPAYQKETDKFQISFKIPDVGDICYEFSAFGSVVCHPVTA